MLENTTVIFLPFLFTCSTYFTGQPGSLLKCYFQKSRTLDCSWLLWESSNIQSRPGNHDTSLVLSHEMDDGGI